MDNLKQIPMSQEILHGLKAKILQSRTLTGADDESVRELQNMTVKCVQDIKDRLAYITERRKQRSSEDKQKNLDFAAALAERDALKDSERAAEGGQMMHRTRIEVWRDEVKQHFSVEKKTASDTVPEQQQKPSRHSTAKRPHDEQLADTATPINKRIRTAAQNDSSSAIAPPTSSKKSIPWLSTRVSMADEDVFADEARRYPDQEIQLNNKKNAGDDNDEHDDHDDADEEFDKDEDATSEDSLESYLTELEQMLTREMAMVTVMALMLPRMIQKSDTFHQGLEEGDLL